MFTSSLRESNKHQASSGRYIRETLCHRAGAAGGVENYVCQIPIDFRERAHTETRREILAPVVLFYYTDVGSRRLGKLGHCKPNRAGSDDQCAMPMTNAAPVHRVGADS